MATPKDQSERPLSWGERVEQRKQRRQKDKPPRGRWLGKRWRAVRHFFGARSVIVVDGVRYRERSTVSLRRALGESGPGFKLYQVRFASGAGREVMRIRATSFRVFDDLSADPRAVMYRQICSLIRPGSRVLELGCGTGGGSRVLSEAVGPSGGVVAVNRDGEALRFARQRYLLNNTGFEMGWIETLNGEIDGAFDVVCVVDPMRAAEDDPARSSVIGELWRVLRPGGLMVMLCSSDAGDDGAIGRMEAAGCAGLRILDSAACGGWIGAAGVKPGKKEPERGHKEGADPAW